MPYDAKVKVALVNLDDPDPRTNRLQAQFNPSQLEIDLKAVWNKLVVPGMSHPVPQFSHTEETGFSFDLIFQVTTPTASNSSASDFEDARGGRNLVTVSANSRFRTIPAASATHFTIQDRERAENFLRALTVPQGGGTVLTTRPPRVLLVWPSYMSCEGRIDSVKLVHTRFNSQGAPTFLTASIRMFDVHDLRFTSAEVLVSGFNTPRKSGSQ